jgi:hypothetical protein
MGGNAISLLKDNNLQGFACCLLHADFLFDFIFNPEDGGNMFLQNTG